MSFLVDHLSPFFYSPYGTVVVLIILIVAIIGVVLSISALKKSADANDTAQRMSGSGGMVGRITKLEMTINDLRTDFARGAEKNRFELIALSTQLTAIRNILEGLPADAPRDDFCVPGQQLRQYEPSAELMEKSYYDQEIPEKESEKIEEIDTEKKTKELTSEPLSKRLKKSRAGLFERLKSIFKSQPVLNEEMLEELHMQLIASDIGTKTSQKLIDKVKEDILAGISLDESSLRDQLKNKIIEDLSENVEIDSTIKTDSSRPFVIFVVGVNGVGKTTTIAKLAAKWIEQKKKVMLIAGDTFRAAATEQLSSWADRTGADIVQGKEGDKPQTVVFDGVKKALDEAFDVVIIDTAGRLHTKTNLMQELEGVLSTIKRHIPDAPHETILVVDGTTGQNALSQAKEFHSACNITGIIVTKLDGTPKGGIVVAIKSELGIPIRYIGVGEGPFDLRPFDANEFVNALFDSSDLIHNEKGISANAEIRRRKRRDTKTDLAEPL